MKVQGAKKVHYDSGPNMTPLVDVVMVILIFLMLAGSFGSGSEFLMSKQGIHQKGSGGGHVDPDQPPDIDVQINVADVGFTATVPGNRPTHSAEAVKQELDAIREKYNKQGVATSKLQVVLYPAGFLKHQYVIQVYDAAMRANFEKIAFATEH